MNLSKATNKFMLFLLVYMVFFPIALMSFLGLLSSGFFPVPFGFDMENMNIPLMNVIVTSNTFLLPVIFFCLLTGLKFRDIIPLKAIDFADIILIIAMSIMMMIYSAMFGSLGDIFTSNTVGETITEESAQYSFPTMAFSVGIAPAVLEELVFRGVILSGYKKAGAVKAIFLSGLFFGMMHLNLYQFFYTFPMGIILAVMVYYSGSIFSSVLSHFVINFSQVVLMYIFQTSDMPEEVEMLAQTAPTLAEKFSVFLATIPICTVITPFFVIALKAFVNRHKTYSENGFICKGCSQIYEKEKVLDLPFILIIAFYGICIILIEYMERMP